MKLITPVFEALLKDYPLYSQEKEKDPMVIAKLFMTQGSATWYIIIKASLDLRVDYIFGLSLKGFWLDADISTWVQSGMIIAYATTIKWMSKYEIK